jgi:hypothetical protein
MNMNGRSVGAFNLDEINLNIIGMDDMILFFILK